MSEPKATQNVVVTNSQGLHLRAAGMFGKLASGFDAEIEVSNGKQQVDGKSITHLMLLGATAGTELTIVGHGPDAVEAVEALAKLVARGFDEKEEAHEQPENH